MSEILSIEQLKAMANPVIQIPSFDNTGSISVKVRKPQLLKMASQGRIPNHLLDIAVAMVAGEDIKGSEKLSEEEKIKMIASTMDLYCMACLVEPSYEDFKDILTDDQKGYIFSWGIGQVSGLNSFRTDTADGTHDNDGEEVQSEA